MRESEERVGKKEMRERMRMGNNGERMCLIRLRLLVLNEYQSGVIEIFIESVCHIGRCIVGSQAI